MLLCTTNFFLLKIINYVFEISEMFFNYWLIKFAFLLSCLGFSPPQNLQFWREQRVWIGSMKRYHPGKMLYSKMVSILWTPHIPRTTGLATMVPSDHESLPRDSHISGPSGQITRGTGGSAKLTVNVTVPLEKALCFLGPLLDGGLRPWDIV